MKKYSKEIDFIEEQGKKLCLEDLTGEGARVMHQSSLKEVTREFSEKHQNNSYSNVKRKLKYR